MATLQRIRNHSVALLVIVGLAMLAFIIGDILTSSSSIMQSSRDKVVTVNGKKVTYEEFEAERTRKTEFIKTMMGQDLNTEASQQLTQQVYNQFITQQLLDETCQKLGLDVTGAEVNELVQGDHTSTVLQQYFGQSAKQVGQYFANLVINDSFSEVQQQVPFATYNNWMEIESEVKLQRLLEKYTALATAAVKPNKLEARDNFDGDNEQASFAYVRKTSYSVADSLVSVDGNDIKTYYEATKRLYRTPGSRTVSYISVPLHPSQADYDEALAELTSVRDEFATNDDVSDLVNGNSIVPYVDAYVNLNAFDNEVRAFVEENGKDAILEPELSNGIYKMVRIIDKTVAPDSVEVELIVVSSKEKADSVKQLLAAKDADFAAIAATANDNQQLAQQAGQLGWLTDATALQQLGPELRDVVLATSKGSQFTYERSLGTQTTYFIGRVTDKTAPIAKAKVAIYAVEVTPSSTTRRDEYGKLNNFLIEHKTVRDMQATAADAGFAMLSTTLFPTSYNVGPVSDARQAVRFAFQEDLGSVSQIYETDDYLLVVVPTAAAKEGYTSLKDTTFIKQLRARVLPEKKIEYIIDTQLANVGERTLEAYAEALSSRIDTASFVNFNLGSISGIGAEPAVVAAALGAQPGEVVGPIAGKSSVVVLKLIDKEGKNLEYDEAARLQSLARSSDYSSAANPLAVLEENADIEDNRISFY